MKIFQKGNWYVFGFDQRALPSQSSGRALQGSANASLPSATADAALPIPSTGAYRIYALSRIKNIKITKEQFSIPEGFDISKEVDLSFGTAVEVLAPESLRDEIRANAEKILEKYKR